MTIKNTEKNNVVPIIIEKSFDIIALTNCSPIPGIAKICSITSEPVSKPAASGPKTVTSGINALRKACLNAISNPFAPLDFANSNIIRT